MCLFTSLEWPVCSSDLCVCPQFDCSRNFWFPSNQSNQTICYSIIQLMGNGLLLVKLTRYIPVQIINRADIAHLHCMPTIIITLCLAIICVHTIASFYVVYPYTFNKHIINLYIHINERSIHLYLFCVLFH